MPCWTGSRTMTECKSPPGPREMVQEHKVIHTYSPPGFVSEGGLQLADPPEDGWTAAPPGGIDVEQGEWDASHR